MFGHGLNPVIVGTSGYFLHLLYSVLFGLIFWSAVDKRKKE